ncbi:DUF2064 domain-containing protein, partial [Actinomadura sp. BRA 177]|uniref:TIGR04282 family arsenosugar biosynthesis glycosyltransferase n=1 Tax=Actinomadura sp. BRA 177 TaxID=2745202 RepID=UPI0020CD3791
MTAADFIVIAKEPVPGRVKTRLTPAYTPAEAAALAEAALRDTLTAVAAAPAGRRTLALDGAPGPWLPAGFTVLAQRGGGLDERLAAAFADAWAGRPLVLLGMDTPQVTPGLLTRAARDLEHRDAVLGPAADGGFWLLGLRRPDARLLRGVPMSRPDTGTAQLARRRRRAREPVRRRPARPGRQAGPGMIGELYEEALRGRGPVEIEHADGRRRPLPVQDWLAPRPGDAGLLDRCRGG